MALDRSTLVWDSRSINMQLEQLVNQLLAEEDITAVQAQILLHVLQRAEAGTSVTALHRELHYSKATVSSLIKRLRQKGYVRMELCREDDRRRLLFGTEKGLRVRKFLEDSIRGAEDRLYRGFSAQELATLDHLQRKMLHNLSDGRTYAQREVSTT